MMAMTTEERRQRQREASARYRARNPEKIRALQQRTDAKRRADPEVVLKRRLRQREYAQRVRESPEGVKRRRLVALKYTRRDIKGLPADPPFGSPCELCGVTSRKLVPDHNHKSGWFRGWLCTPCNVALGALGDDEDGIGRVLQYLRDAGSRVVPK